MTGRSSAPPPKRGKTFEDILNDMRIKPIGQGSVQTHGWEQWAQLHLLSADTLAHLSAEIEAKPGPPDEEAWIMHRAFLTGSIILSVVFMESAVNELFAEAYANPFGTVQPLGRQIISDLGQRTFSKRVAFLSKYQSALGIAGKPGFRQDAQPYKDADALRALRNELEHYTPEWKSSTIAGRLTEPPHWLADKCPPNRMFPPNAAESLHKYLGEACAKWAVKSSLRFVDEFYSRLGITPPYENFRARLDAG